MNVTTNKKVIKWSICHYCLVFTSRLFFKSFLIEQQMVNEFLIGFV